MSELTRMFVKAILFLAPQALPSILMTYLMNFVIPDKIIIHSIMWFQLVYNGVLILAIWIGALSKSGEIHKAGGYVGASDTFVVPWVLTIILVAEPLLLIIFWPEHVVAGSYLIAASVMLHFPLAGAHLEYTEREVSQKVIEPKEE